ncbi:MAG: hypothetical protein IJ107_06140 [Lachnospiraceae bacterium]|nr:hypothetical protein [Lachnospiraceae bacterium]
MANPVWAWYMWEGARKKPDLRQKRWGYGWKGERFACMEIDIPEEKLILSDYDTWSIILIDGLLDKLDVPIGIGQGMQGKTGKLGVGKHTKAFDVCIMGCPPEEEKIYEELKAYILKKRA